MPMVRAIKACRRWLLFILLLWHFHFSSGKRLRYEVLAPEIIGLYLLKYRAVVAASSITIGAHRARIVSSLPISPARGGC